MKTLSLFADSGSGFVKGAIWKRVEREQPA